MESPPSALRENGTGKFPVTREDYLDMEPLPPSAPRENGIGKFPVKNVDQLESFLGVTIDQYSLSLAFRIATRYSDALQAAIRHAEYKRANPLLSWLVNEKLNTDKSLSSPSEVIVHRELAVELLAKACNEVITDFHLEEEDYFDENLLICASVEFIEISKEINPSKRFWFDYVKDEYEELKDKWSAFEGKWMPLLQLRRRSQSRSLDVAALRRLRLELLSYLQQPDVVTSTVVLGLSTLASEMEHSPIKDKNELLTVYPLKIAKVARSLAGIPKSWLLHTAEPLFIPCVGPKFARRLVRQEVPKLAVTNALLRRRLKPRRHPIASFLFVGGPGCGRTEMAKALAEELFDGKDLLTEFDMSKYRVSDVVSYEDRCECPKSVFREHLIEAVKKKPFGVVVLDNTEMARSSDVDIVVEVLTHGTLRDGQGCDVDFTTTLIIMTSNAVDEPARLQPPFTFRRCKCDEIVKKFPLKELEKNSSSGGGCRHLFFIKEARKHFTAELFDRLDDVVVFEPLAIPHHKCVARFLLRDIACSITRKRFFIYASEAALRTISSAMWSEGHLKIWLENNMVPVILQELPKFDEIDDMVIVYIDALVGTGKLSYRWEITGVLEYQELGEFLTTSRELRNMHEKEKAWVNKSFLLKEICSELWADGQKLIDRAKISEIVGIVDSLLENAVDVSASDNNSLVAFSSLKEDAESIDQLERSSRMANKGMTHLRAGLENLKTEEFIGVVAEAFLRSLDLPRNPVKAFLLLGLTKVGKANLVKGLRKHFVSDDGTSLLFRIDMSNCNSGESCFASVYTCHEQALRRVPYVVFFIEGVEEARASDFSSLMSLLDRGALSDRNGRKVVFSNSIVLIAANCGVREYIGKFVDEKFEEKLEGRGYREETKTFRFELLNRMDEIVLFSLVRHEDRPRKFARLSMKAGSGEKAKGAQSFTFPLAFQELFLPLIAAKRSRSTTFGELESVKYFLHFVVEDGGISQSS